MSKTNKVLIIILIIAITAVLGITVLSFGSDKNEKTVKKDVYIMKTVDNTVALFKNEDLIRVFDGIVVDTLPINDRLLLEKGIEFSSESEASLAAEDYDG